MRYSHYTVTDFVMDEDFQQWVSHPDAAKQAKWDALLAQRPDLKDSVEQARALLLSIDFRKTSAAEIQQSLMWENIQASLQEPIALEEFPKLRPLNRLPFFHRWRKLAAVLVGLLLLSAGAYYLVVLRQTVTYTTAYGDHQIIQLPDGSTVTLNANSTLTYNRDWQTNHVREVWLEGEAFFRVVKQAHLTATKSPSSRFVVHTPQLNIEVLGTEFDVNNRRGNIRVVLKSGKVSLSRNNAEEKEELVMEPKDLVDYSEASQQLVKSRVNPDQYASWVNKQLVFNETPLAEIAQVLEDSYGFSVVFENEELANRKFTGSVSTEQPELLLTAIAESFQINVIRSDQTIRIHN